MKDGVADFGGWNKAFLDHFFAPERVNQRIHLSVTEDFITEIGGESGLSDFVEVVKLGPPINFGKAKSVCSRARILMEKWVEEGKKEPPPFLPYLALFVIAAGRESPEGFQGFHKRFHEILGEEPQNITPGFDRMWEVWQQLADWSKNEREGFQGAFECKIEAGSRAHVSIPLSQILLRPSERRKLPAFFAGVGIDPNNPPSDQELIRLIGFHGLRFGLRDRTLKAIKGELGQEFQTLLIESIFDELHEWEPLQSRDLEGVPNECNGHIVINLFFEGASGTTFHLYRIYNDGRLEEGKMTLSKGGEETFSVRMPVVGWSSEIKADTACPSFDWSKTTEMTSGDGKRFILRGGNFKIFELGQKRGLDQYVETRRLTASQPFLLALSENCSDLKDWGEQSCPGWRELSGANLAPGWKLFSADRAKDVQIISAKYPAFASPLAFRLRLAGGLKLQKGHTYLKGYPPRVEVESSDAEHVLILNGVEIAVGKGLFTHPLRDHSDLLKDHNRVSIHVIGEQEKGGRGQQFLIQNCCFLSKHEKFCPINYSPIGGAVQGGRVEASMSIAEYPLQQDYFGRRILLIGRQVGQIAPASEWDSISWTPVWLLEKRGRSLKLQFCGTSEDMAAPISSNSSNGRKIWKRELFARRKEIAALANRNLAAVWKLYLEASNT